MLTNKENMKPTATADAALNDLLEINNARLEKFQKAEKEIVDPDLKSLFKKMADESRKNVSALLHEIKKSGGQVNEGVPSLKGGFYRFGQAVRAIFTGSGRQSILESCAMGEETAQTVYRNAISARELTTEARQLIRNQQATAKTFYTLIMNFKDNRPVYDTPERSN